MAAAPVTWRRLAALAAATLGAGWALGWFVLGPLLGLFLLPVPGGTLPPPAVVSAPSVRQHLASLSPVSAVPVPVPRTSRAVVLYVQPARPRHHATPAPASTVKTQVPTPTPTVTMTPAPTMTPSSPPPSPLPTGTPSAETPPPVTDETPPSP